MFIHPVHIILFLLFVSSISLAWAYVANRRARVSAPSSGQAPSQVDTLRQRVAVLEAIATDPATRLGREIENLRKTT
jgi:hypothetical protein